MLAIHNQLRGIHYRTVTLPGLKLFAILSFPDRCDANFLLRVHTAGIGYPRAIPFGLKALSTSHRLYPSTSAVASLFSVSFSLFLSLPEVLVRNSRAGPRRRFLNDFCNLEFPTSQGNISIAR